MTLAEPMTAITDWILGVLALVLAIRLRVVPPQRSVTRWRWGFVFTAIGSVVAGTYHAVGVQAGASTLITLWKTSAFAVGLAVFFMLLATASSRLPPQAARFLVLFAVLQLLLYALWTLTHNDFVSVITNYGTAMLIVAAVHLITYSRNPESARWVLAGIAVTAVGSLIQAFRVAPYHHFNHNDLFHVIQMVSLVLLDRGARSSRDAR